MTKASPSNSEWLTRKQLIDGKLKAAGWKITPFVPGAPVSQYNGYAVEEFETTTGPADYALCLGGQVIGVVEAKKLTEVDLVAWTKKRPSLDGLAAG